MLYYASSNTYAFEELYSRFNKRIYGYFFSKLKSEDESVDLCQEFFKRIHVNRAKYHPGWKLEPWFFTIAHNMLISYLKKNNRRRTSELEENRMGKGPDEKKLTMLDIEKAVERLPSNQKDAVYLRYFRDYDFKDISDVIGKTPINTRKIISRGIKKLKEKLNA